LEKKPTREQFPCDVSPPFMPLHPVELLSYMVNRSGLVSRSQGIFIVC